MLQINNVSKQYKSSAEKALDNISFTVEKGEFVALLGQNGAGKSTLINILAGNVKKNEGSVSIAGIDLDTHELETKNRIGVVPQEISFDFVFTVEEVLKNQAGYFGLTITKKEIHALLEKLQLADKMSANCRSLSGGMKRRLLIAKAMIHKPDLLILDEPTAGVDIELRHQLYSLLQQLHQDGITIILTTHYLEEADKLCDRILVINKGRLIADEDKDTLMKTLGAETFMEFTFDTDLTNSDISFLSQYNPELIDERRLQLCVFQKDIGSVFQQMSDRKLFFSSFKVEAKKLEDVYLQLINGKAA